MKTIEEKAKEFLKACRQDKLFKKEVDAINNQIIIDFTVSFTKSLLEEREEEYEQHKFGMFCHGYIMGQNDEKNEDVVLVSERYVELCKSLKQK